MTRARTTSACSIRKLDFDSGAQEPGETVQIAFPQAGSYLVFCGIHPKMELTVDVAEIISTPA